MALFTWDASYSVKVKSCDEQHKKLFDLMNKLSEAMKSGHGRDVLAAIVGDLEGYTKNHFSAEEVLMQRAGYPDLPTHRLQHRHFIEQVANFKKDLAVGGNSVAVLTFLKDWLVKHIQQVDKKYSAHLNNNGIQ